MSTVLLSLGLGALGGAGAVGRFWVHNRVVQADPRDFPLGTFIVNAVGSLVLGLLYGVGAAHDLRLLVGTGLLGAFTTFSTWMFETERLVADGALRSALTNIVVSLGLGLAAFSVGFAVGNMF
ncbi:MAG: fluoride efflux transporter CrcB [Solirubrobacterales bacterium]